MTRTYLGFPTTRHAAATPPRLPSSPCTPSTSSSAPHSPWHSPVPYLFGGLAAMLGLIALALLILACSYWRLSGYPPRGGRGNDDDVEDGDGDQSKAGSGGHAKGMPMFEEKVLVIMAGEKLPTFLATPVFSSAGATSKAAASGDNIKGRERGHDVDGGEGGADEEEEAGTVTGGAGGGSEAVPPSPPPPPPAAAAEVGGDQSGQRRRQQQQQE